MRCIIVDDEPLARLGMEILINAHPQLKLIGSFKSPIGISNFITREKIDLVFLDIEMPALSGLDFADMIRDKTLFIFITAYPQYALKSYELNAVDYLLKPVVESRFMDAVERAFLQYHALEDKKSGTYGDQQAYVMIRAERNNFKVLLKDIIYIEALKDYVIVYSTTQQFISWINLKTFHNKLPQDQFIRINKSIIVNKKHVNSYNNKAVMIDNMQFKIGKIYCDNIILQLSQIL